MAVLMMMMMLMIMVATTMVGVDWFEADHGLFGQKRREYRDRDLCLKKEQELWEDPAIADWGELMLMRMRTMTSTTGEGI